MIASNLPTTLGDEGGFAPSLPNNEKAMKTYEKTTKNYEKQ